jgi:hypothetical protein
MRNTPFFPEMPKGRNFLKDLGVDGKTNIKTNRKPKSKQDSSGSRLGPVADSETTQWAFVFHTR